MTKFTDERVINRLLEGISKGASYEHACNYAGISYQTFRNWMQEGENAKSGKKLAFFEDVKRAEAEAVMSWLDDIDAADSWQAKAWKLERRYPKVYGKQIVAGVGEDDAILIEVVRKNGD